MNDIKLTTKNITTEYSQPGSFLLLRVNGKHTPEMKADIQMYVTVNMISLHLQFYHVYCLTKQTHNKDHGFVSNSGHSSLEGNHLPT